MGEKAYKAMKKTGITNLVLGILAIVAGVAFGVSLIVSGSKLLSNKKNIMF